jgi:hypothetical protein
MTVEVLAAIGSVAWLILFVLIMLAAVAQTKDMRDVYARLSASKKRHHEDTDDGR